MFIGGSTPYKLGDDAAAIVAEARRRGLPAHMGRVNGAPRMAYAATIGCTSVDGTKWARFRATHLARGIAAASTTALGTQLRIGD